MYSPLYFTTDTVPQVFSQKPARFFLQINVDHIKWDVLGQQDKNGPLCKGAESAGENILYNLGTPNPYLML